VVDQEILVDIHHQKEIMAELGFGILMLKDVEAVVEQAQ